MAAGGGGGAHIDAAFFVRRADPDDIETISAMMERCCTQEGSLEAFATLLNLDRGALKSAEGRQRLFISLIETCFMSVTVEDDEGNIAGFAALDDGPIQMSNASGAGTNWEPWFQETFDVPEIDNTNALWFSCCLSEPEPGVMAEILRTTFSTMHELQHLLMVAPPGLSEDDVMNLLSPFDMHFQQLQVREDAPPPDGHWSGTGLDGTRARVLHCQRSNVITPLFIRMARVEDHDNLAAVFDAQSEVVTEVYGEFFIAELIEAQNDENRALVAEVDGRAVGLLCLTSDVDVNVLAQCFQLDPYDNLLKPRYMRRVREHAKAVLQEEDAVSLCSTGDFLQVALSPIDIESLLTSTPKHEDGRVNTIQLLIALQNQDLQEEVSDALQDFERSIMTLLWQSAFLEPMPEVGTFVEPKKVVECVKHFLSLDFTERRLVAQAVLEDWPKAEEVLRITREALEDFAAPEDKREEKADEGLEEDALPRQSSETTNLETAVFLKALTTEEDGPFSQEMVSKLAMILHWWCDENVGAPSSIVPDDGYKSAIEKVLTQEEGLFVGRPDAPTWLANLPQHTKDVFCINMCCLDQAYQTQALDFLLPAFSLYPEKDYCIVTQPHTAPNTPLLNAFTIVPPQPQNTFGHVLYLIHRASLMGSPKVQHLHPATLSQVPALIDTFSDDAQKDILAQCQNFVKAKACQEDSAMQCFAAEFDEQVVGLIILEVPPSDVVDTLRCCYHLDDYLLVDHHEQIENKGHARLVHWVVNPLFQKYTRRLLQGTMRICGRTVLFSEMELQSTVSPIFREMLQVAPRRPPQLKKVVKRPPKVASFANIEKPVPTAEELKENERQAQLRDGAQTKALSIVAKKLLSETKIPVNARIVVVGASDCGLSFLESLLSIPHLHFNSLTLLAPGGLEYHHAHHLPLVAGTAAYSHQELRRIMLELRVRILDSRMVQIDRQQRCCILHDGSMLPYDFLIVAAGLQDDALHTMKIRSWGVEHVTEGYRRVNGAMSAADPSIRDLLVEGGTLVKSLIWNPLSYAVVYGRSLHAYCVVQGLLLRKVPPTKIIMVLPPRIQDGAHQLPVDAFYEGDEVGAKIHDILETIGVRVHDGYRLLGIQQDNRQRLKALVLEDYTGRAAENPDDATTPRVLPGDKSEQRPEAPSKAHVQHGIMEDNGISNSGLPQKVLTCRIVITADSVNVDPDIFNSVHGNGLVYDGRLIVDHNFKTTDNGIFGAGSLCEFSRRFQRKNAQRYLRHDGFNGREVGAKLAQALLRVLDPVNGDMLAAGAGAHAPKTQASPVSSPAQKLDNTEPQTVGLLEEMEAMDSEDSSPDLLPDFYMPTAKGGLLPGNLHYYRIQACRRGDMHAESDPKPEQAIVTDTLDTTNGTGHFCRLTMDNFGKVDSITYLGGEELQVESLWSLVGLSETFLNHLYARWRDGDIPDIVEFLADEWATALFHDRFMDFCHQIKLEMVSKEEVKDLINTALETVNLQDGLSRELLAKIRSQLRKESVKAMQDHLLDYLRENTNHLKQYFLPENWAKA